MEQPAAYEGGKGEENLFSYIDLPGSKKDGRWIYQLHYQTLLQL
jgi:hypothetical protein